MVPEFSVAS